MAGQAGRPVDGKTVAILVAFEFEDVELFYPLLRLSEAGAQVLVTVIPVGYHPRPYLPDKPVTGRFGLPAASPVLPPGRHYRLAPVQELNAAGLDAVVIPGGFSPDFLRRDLAVLELVRECHLHCKLLAAIGHGPWVLISAGVIAGRDATGVSAIKDDLINALARYVDQPVVVDGNVITSRTSDDLPEFCAAIIEWLQVES